MQHVGPISLVFFWFSVIFILKKWDFDVKLTLSDHVKSGIARNVYTPSALVTMTAYYAFTILWFLPRLEAHWTAYMFISIAYFMKLATTIVPRSKKHLVFHDATATLVGSSLFFLLVTLAAESGVDGVLRNVLWASIVVMSVFGYLVMNRTREHYLALQGIYFFIFTANIILLTYLGT